ncbi:hypothetical protein RIR_jg4781.t1 [Rhizophagus irregularis DAOM 181602=DAOM 197198]|nr:hypothetical protein RIR_jg4781.t1 [Rhizophagus irregularis DAOM 181602=DAOM 197198]
MCSYMDNKKESSFEDNDELFSVGVIILADYYLILKNIQKLCVNIVFEWIDHWNLGVVIEGRISGDLWVRLISLITSFRGCVRPSDLTVHMLL